MGVPVYRVEIRKSRMGKSWSNDYQIETIEMADAVTMAQGALAWERSFHMASVNFDYYRVSTTAIGDRTFRHVVVNLPGLAGAGGTDYLPLFNTLRFDMQTDDSDPCRKYFRLPLPEGLVTNELIDPGTMGAIDSTFGTWKASWPVGTRVVSTKGNIVVSGVCCPVVQMRQLHRHKRKKIV